MLKLLKKLEKKDLMIVGVAIVLILGQIYCDLKLPDYMSELTVLINTPGSVSKDVLFTGVKMLGIALCSALLAVICGYFIAKLASGFGYKIRMEVFNKVADFTQEEMTHFSVASLITRTTNDIVQVQQVIAMGLQIMVKAPIMAVWAIIKIVNKSWTLSMITGGFIVGLLMIMMVVVTVVVPRFKRVQKLTDQINKVARENLNGINVVHAYNAEEYQNAKFNKVNMVLYNTQLFNQRTMALLVPMVTFAMNALALTIYWVGAGLIDAISVNDIAARTMMFGNIVVFGTYATYVVMSIMMMVMIIMFLPAAQVSAGRINEVLETKIKLQPGKETVAKEVGTITFKNVSFKYPSSAKNVLEDISFEAKKGETVAFIGATGSGKTTLVSLAARFYDVTAGEVLLDGQDIRNYTFDALYDRIGYITQKAILFAGDVKSNILFGDSKGEPTEENVHAALKLAQASEFVSKMKYGIKSRIAQQGTNVSGGQKQRLSIARALARKPEILIFDDSFSALDYKTDAQLRLGLQKELHDTTKLIVAQRIGTIKNADKIIVLSDGKMVGSGTHEELLKTCQVYQEIALSQLSSEELAGIGGDINA
ncbi:MAG: ABC transporter ATP-binding protein/permease [Erysipelotrichaceae bacterium]|nr:ABC transporter ATP-binding protein/permease [Erysipelotrichaceae bacterium]MDY5252119.1 ABC transporter ATP-binding protein [Erysipelotrichaceae bacterium]